MGGALTPPLAKLNLKQVFAASQMLVLTLSKIKGFFFIEIFLQKLRHLYISDEGNLINKTSWSPLISEKND
jgi:hypothetical protein